MSKLISELRISSEAISKTLIMLIKTEDNSNQNDLINLKKSIDTILGSAKQDLDVTYKMLVELLRLCTKYDASEVDRLVTDIKTLCSNNLTHRASLCAEVINSFFNIKNVAKPSLDINLFVDADTDLVFQYLFNSKDVMGSIIQCDYQSFIDRLKESELFGAHIIYINMTRYQKSIEKKFVEFAKVRQTLAPKHFNARDFTVTDEMRERFTALNKYGANPFSQSTPTSPVNKEQIILAPTSLSSRETSSFSQHAISVTPTLAPSFQRSRIASSSKNSSDSIKINRHNVPHLPLDKLHMRTDTSQQYQHQDLQNLDCNTLLEEDLSSSLAKLIIDFEPKMVINSTKENNQSHKGKADSKAERDKRIRHG